MPVFHIRLEIGASGLRRHSSIAQHAHLTMVTHGVRDGRWALFPQARVEGVAQAVAEEVSAVQSRPCPPSHF
jgi:hypothetical protein